MRILVYCQSLVGVGHLTASLRIADALLEQGLEVDLIHGGIDAPMPAPRPGWRTLRLPTLLHDEDQGEFFSPEGDDVQVIWGRRAAAIAGFLGGRYDAVLLEFYPFGRRRFKAEIMALLRSVHDASGPVPVFTSVREVLVPRSVDTERRMVASVRKHIHTVFVRGDPDLIAFDETFSLAHEIADRLCHTGYLAPSRRDCGAASPRQPQVLVSQGGGDVGRALLDAAIGAAVRLPQLHFLLACGSRTPVEDVAALRARVRGCNVEIQPFLPDFVERLSESAVSINMGGDNTLLDVLRTRTPSLAYPYQGNPEQGIRIRKFARGGLVHELSDDDLVPDRLASRIEHALNAPYPSHRVAMNGAQVTAQRIMAVLGHPASVAAA
jgi:predicted glycosyltransferase